jgi:hypothetical protein
MFPSVTPTGRSRLTICVIGSVVVVVRWSLHNEPLSIPEWKWGDISMDCIVGLPLTARKLIQSR